MSQVIADIGSSSASEAIDAALRFYRQIQTQRALLDLQGKIEFSPDYDYKAMRTNHHHDEWK